jgi:hypothetical protein
MATTTTVTLSKADFLASKPSWAKAALVASVEENACDYMTDYFATKTTKRVVIGWSKHSRDLFSEMRKAAATFAPTAHLGPGKNRFMVYVALAESFVSNGSAYYKGESSHWHSDLTDGERTLTFWTKAAAEGFIAAHGGPRPVSFDGVPRYFDWAIREESIEHREKYSMGAGYYLKATGRYSDGWKVSKTSWFGSDDTVEVAATLAAA